MKKKKLRYKSAKDIEDAIDSTKEKQAYNAAEAERLDKLAKSLFLWTSERNPDALEGAALQEYRTKHGAAIRARNACDKLRKAHGRFEKRLIRLKKTLAAFLTDIMPFEKDCSVVLQ